MINPPERTELTRRVRARNLPAADADRARVILARPAGKSIRATARTVGGSPYHVQR